MNEEQRFVLLHGFSDEELSKVMKACRAALPEKEFVFAVTTPTNMQWKVGDLMEEVVKEHEFMKKQRGNS
ncbi:DUF3783 domain-containing protein [Coprothermobacter platensis]|jgi:hypothetical protein|uniref:DUF3783 domain-containing protein n=1 Tax=Coprothermobacter platensis TaxID=108819 RepID=UPI0003657F73|nr:DUF3783 domain-containing protein [Coprothermobacter platensis]